jgi:hypothetical protein
MRNPITPADLGLQDLLWRKPLIQSLPNKLIVIEVWIGCIHPVNLLFLPRAKSFIGIKAPYSFEQSLPSQHFMKPGNATGELIRGVKERRICIGDFDASLQKRKWHTVRVASGLLALVK